MMNMPSMKIIHKKVTCPKCGRIYRSSIVTMLAGECFLCVMDEVKKDD